MEGDNLRLKFFLGVFLERNFVFCQKLLVRLRNNQFVFSHFDEKTDFFVLVFKFEFSNEKLQLIIKKLCS